MRRSTFFLATVLGATCAVAHAAATATPAAGTAVAAAASGMTKDQAHGLAAQAAGGDAAALDQLMKAADQGDTQAAYMMGLIYDYGHRDQQKAAAYFKTAADKGDADAEFKLGWACLTGGGVIKDVNQALSWFQKSAEQGNVNAQFNLGTLYSAGGTVPRDWKQAFFWLEKAADQGNAAAANKFFYYLMAVDEMKYFLEHTFEDGERISGNDDNKPVKYQDQVALLKDRTGIVVFMGRNSRPACIRKSGGETTSIRTR